jgi:hypothetical protein
MLRALNADKPREFKTPRRCGAAVAELLRGRRQSLVGFVVSFRTARLARRTRGLATFWSARRSGRSAGLVLSTYVSRFSRVAGLNPFVSITLNLHLLAGYVAGRSLLPSRLLLRRRRESDRASGENNDRIN